MKKEYIVAQNQHTLSFGEQVMHVKRAWIFLLALLVFFLSKSVLVTGVVFLLSLFLSVKVYLLDTKEKEGLLHFLVAYYSARFLARTVERLSRLLRYYMHLSFLLLISFPFAQNIEPPPKKVETPSLPAPPPPPPPTTEPATPSEVQVQPMTTKEVEALLRRENIKNFILDGQYHLAPGGHARMPLRENNLVHFHPTMPVLLVFDKEIEDVYILSSISLFYDERSIFLLGPSQVYAGFAVVFKDKTYAYFTLVQATDFNTKKYHKEDQKLDQFLQTGKNFPSAPQRKLTTFYYFYTPKLVPLSTVVEVYLKSRTTCPVDGEVFTYEGVSYKVIRIGKEGVLRGEGDFYACGFYWRVLR